MPYHWQKEFRKKAGAAYRRYVVTTKLGKRLPEVPDNLKLKFEAKAPNTLRVSDIIYVRTGQGWLYLAAILDLFSRQVLGWAMAPTLS